MCSVGRWGPCWGNGPRCGSACGWCVMLVDTARCAGVACCGALAVGGQLLVVFSAALCGPSRGMGCRPKLSRCRRRPGCKPRGRPPPPSTQAGLGQPPGGAPAAVRRPAPRSLPDPASRHPPLGPWPCPPRGRRTGRRCPPTAPGPPPWIPPHVSITNGEKPQPAAAHFASLSFSSPSSAFFANFAAVPGPGRPIELGQRCVTVRFTARSRPPGS